MIRLNLIEAAQRESVASVVKLVRVTNVAEQAKSSRQKSMLVIAAALFAVVGFSAFLSVNGVPQSLQGIFPDVYLDLIGAEDPSRKALTLTGGQQTTAGGSMEAQAAAARALEAQRSAMSIKQFVGEVNPQALYKTNRSDYNSYFPMEKVSYSRASFAQFFAFLNSATPDDVGFSDCIYQAPNYFYVRGIAAKPTSQKSFLERITAVSTNFKTPPLPENAPATDITAFGEFNLSNINLNAVAEFVKSANVNAELDSLKNLAQTAKVNFKGFEKPTVEDFGVFKRLNYRLTTQANFPEIQNFIESLSQSKVRVGIQKAELKFAKRDLATSLHLEMYVVP